MTLAQRTVPEAARVAPTRPPIRACDEEEGRPKYQVIRFQTIAPATPAKTTPRLAEPVGRVTRPLPAGCAALSAEVCADELADRGHQQRHTRGQSPGGAARGDRVGGVVEAVRVVERER